MLKKSAVVLGIAIFSMTALGVSTRQMDPVPNESSVEWDIRTALQKNAQAMSSEEWEASGYLPSDIFQNAKDLKNQTAWQDLCSALAKLPPTDLALFEDQITEHSSALPCASDLKKALKNYWQDARLKLEKRTGCRGTPTASVTNTPIAVNIDHGTPETNLPAGQVALTFDDGPSPFRTERILKALNQAGVRAAFFQVARRAKQYPKISEAIVKAEHTLGSHGASHVPLSNLALRQAEKEIHNGRRILEDILRNDSPSIEIPFFRFPYETKTAHLENYLRENRMAVLPWNIDSLDWKLRDPSALYQHLIQALDEKKGGVLLFHDTQEQTTVVLPYLLKELEARNVATVVFTAR